MPAYLGQIKVESSDDLAETVDFSTGLRIIFRYVLPDSFSSFMYLIGQHQ